MGELLKQIDPGTPGRRPELDTASDTQLNRKEAAKEAGLSKRQKDDALRVASIPKHQFEELIESDAPPTATQLAELGTKKKPPNQLEGIDPEVFKAGTKLCGFD